MIKKQEPAESILARQDSEDDESFGDLQPAPSTAGEWTTKDGVIYVALDDGGTVGWPMRYMAHAVEVVECHNVAMSRLAAEVQTTVTNNFKDALAAERKRYGDLQRSVMDLSHPNCKVLLKERNEAREQFAAEREKLRIALADNAPLLAEVAQLREQLAAEQRKHDRELADVARRYVKQLATAGNKLSATQAELDGADKVIANYKRWLATAVDALKKIISLDGMNPIWTPTRLAQTELAKIEEGKSCS